MYGLGEGGLPFFSVAQHIGRCTQTWHCTVHPFLFRITVIVSIPFFRQGWDPIRADIPLFVDRDMCPKIHVAKPWWGASFDPKTGQQKRWPQRSSECRAPCGCMKVAVNRRYEASWPAWQVPESPSSRLHPQSVPFCKPKAFVVHWGKQQPVE